MIDFGKYDRRCKFISLGAVSDGAGGFLPSETVELETFCRVIQLSGTSNIEQAQLGLPKTYTLGIQYRNGFEPNTSLMIDYDGNRHKITGVDLNSERQRKEWVITMVRS
jgi:SPP1 family predicted phage head-tail adaptor